MKNRLIAFVAMLAVCAGVVATAPGAPAVQAVTGDPVVTVVAASAVVAGTPITFDVTIDQAGYAPSNGSQKITWFNQSTGRTLNRANYTVIPMTTLAGPVWRFTYVPDSSDVGHYLTFSVAVPVSAARIPRTVPGVATFLVLAVPATTTTTTTTTTTPPDTTLTP